MQEHDLEGAAERFGSCPPHASSATVEKTWDSRKPSDLIQPWTVCRQKLYSVARSLSVAAITSRGIRLSVGRLTEFLARLLPIQALLQ
jgi:hypothetical protein